MKAKKSFGQHFLNQESIAFDIAQGISASKPTDCVVEIGPGQGVLTKYLLEKPYRLLCVEADKDMVKYLKHNYPQLEGNLILQDVLKVRFEEHFDDQFYVIGNFPYNISSQILFQVLKYRDRVPEMVGMFQKEVSDRVVAPPGSRTYGVTSVLMQAFYHGETLFDVDKSCFTPPPKVQSSVIKLTRKENQDLGVDFGLFKSIVKTSFGQRRKMLRNTMKSFLKDSDFLKDPSLERRPEQLSVEDFVALTKEVIAYRASVKDK